MDDDEKSSLPRPDDSQLDGVGCVFSYLPLDSTERLSAFVTVAQFRLFKTLK